jgi:hypothetical protein
LKSKLFGLIATVGALVTGWALFRSRICQFLGCTPERITISTPGAAAVVTSPLTVSGWGSATQHNQLSIEVRDASNMVIGNGTASVTGALGQPGTYSGAVTFSPATPGSPGFIQVFDTSPATGATTHLAAVMVTFA